MLRSLFLLPVLSAVTEIKRLNDRIETIEAGYEKQLTETINKINRRYAAQLDTLNKAKKSEFETDADFKADQDKKRTNLQTQKNVELANIPTLSSLASAETTPLHESINELAEREYGVGMESLTVEIALPPLRARRAHTNSRASFIASRSSARRVSTKDRSPKRSRWR